MKKKYNWLMIGLASIIAIVLIAFIIDDLLIPKDIKITETPQNIIGKNKEQINEVQLKHMSRDEIINDMHEMSNTLIVADEIWGEIKITQEKAIRLMAEVNDNKTISDREKEKLLNILNAWEKQDFSQGVAEHNYLWDLLGGNIGKARTLREEYRK